MIRDHGLVFNDRIISPLLSTKTKTSDDWAERLSIYDVVVIQVVLDQIAGSANGTLGVVAEHSPDGVFWQDLATVIDPNAPSSVITLSQTNVYAGYYAVGLPFTRLVVTFNGGGGAVTAANAKIYAVMRDVAEE
jgi:hypothetical protein